MLAHGVITKTWDVQSLWKSTIDTSLTNDHDVVCAWAASHTRIVVPLLEKALFTNPVFLSRVMSALSCAGNGNEENLIKLVETIPKDTQIHVSDQLLTMLETHIPTIKRLVNVGIHLNLYTALHPTIGNDDRFKLAWLTAGGANLDSFPERWWLDEDVFLLVGKRREYFSRDSVIKRYTQNGMLNRKELLLKAVKAGDVMPLSKAFIELQKDPKLLTEALDMSYFSEFSSLFKSPHVTKSNLVSKIQARKAFDSLILPSIYTTSRNDSTLSIPGQVGNAVIRILAEFVGYPFEHSLKTLENAYDGRCC